MARRTETVRADSLEAVIEEHGFSSLFVSAGDGIKLHARSYGPTGPGALPVICLPGLTRTAADFHDLAMALSRARKQPRRVLALDYRGRGLSERDRNWRNYNVRAEAQDTLQMLTALGVDEALFVGVSRGGLIAMALAAIRPTLVRGVVLNDIGPVIDARGLIRIRGHVGKLPQPGNWREAGVVLRRLMSAQFPSLTDAEWETMARGTWVQGKRGLGPAYDPALMKSLAAIDLEAPLPELWPLFGALNRVPVLTLRGANSDILSEHTLAEMGRRHPDFEAHLVADQGHAPLLSGEDTIQRIMQFLDHAEPA